MTHPRRIITLLMLLALTLAGLVTTRPAVAETTRLTNLSHLDFGGVVLLFSR